jgi:hypothetical protein
MIRVLTTPSRPDHQPRGDDENEENAFVAVPVPGQTVAVQQLYFPASYNPRSQFATITFFFHPHVYHRANHRKCVTATLSSACRVSDKLN